MIGWPREGGCRCGALRFRANAPPLFTMACHCTGCQRMSSSAFSLGAAFRPDDFEVIAGEPVLGGLKGEIQHNFCPQCLSWVFTRAGEMIVNIRTPMLDACDDLDPFIETYVSEQLPWIPPLTQRRFEKFPEPADYGEIVAGYAGRRR